MCGLIRNRFFCLYLIISFLTFFFALNHLSAEVSGSITRHSEFVVPQKLRPRVNFWKDVFTKYGRSQVIIHHRDFPQIIFGVLDFRHEADKYSPRLFEKYKDREVKRVINGVKSAFKKLSLGVKATSRIEQIVEDRMALLPGGIEKYKRALKEDLIRSQTGIKEKYAEALKRSGRYLPIMEDVFVNEYNLPVELTRIPFIESSFDYTAYSSKGAAGIWQFMRNTGKIYRLTINSNIDERRDPIAATRAAAQYLRDAYDRLRSWPLSITSYNHGVGGVMKKVERAGTTRLEDIIEDTEDQLFGFASNNFYPEFLAALEIYNDYHRYFPGLNLEPGLNIVQVRLDRPLYISMITKKLGISSVSIEEINRALSTRIIRGVTPIPAGYLLKLPAGNREQIALLTSLEPATTPPLPPASSIYGGVTYRVRKGDTLSKIAKKYHTSIVTLRQLNQLKTDSLMPGQVIEVRSPEAGDAQPQRETAQPKKNTKAETSTTSKKVSAESDTERYIVRKGDTLWSISNQFGLSVSEIKRLNNLKGSSVKAGAALKLPKN